MRCQRAAHQPDVPQRTGACQLCSSAMLGEELCFRHTTILGSRRWSSDSKPSCVDRSTGGLWLCWCVCSKRFCTHIPWNQIQHGRRLAWPCFRASDFHRVRAQYQPAAILEQPLLVSSVSREVPNARRFQGQTCSVSCEDFKNIYIWYPDQDQSRVFWRSTKSSVFSHEQKRIITYFLRQGVSNIGG